MLLLEILACAHDPLARLRCSFVAHPRLAVLALSATLRCGSLSISPKTRDKPLLASLSLTAPAKCFSVAASCSEVQVSLRDLQHCPHVTLQVTYELPMVFFRKSYLCVAAPRSRKDMGACGYDAGLQSHLEIRMGGHRSYQRATCLIIQTRRSFRESSQAYE